MTIVLPPYISRGVKICQSVQHPHLFILNYPDGGFCTISSAAEVMLRTHPRDIVENFREQDKFNFTRTSNYVLQKKANFTPHKFIKM